MGEWVAREEGHLDGCFYDSIASLYDLHTMEVNIWHTLLSFKRYQILTIGAAGKSILTIMTILLLLLTMLGFLKC